MKIGIPVIEENRNARIDSRFGRCAYFAIVDSESGEGEVIENPGAVAFSGAGVRAVETLINAGVEAVITPDVGPNSAQSLQEGGIRVLRASDSLTVQEALGLFRDGKLEYISGPTPRGVGRHNQEHHDEEH